MRQMLGPLGTTGAGLYLQGRRGKMYRASVSVYDAERRGGGRRTFVPFLFGNQGESRKEEKAEEFYPELTRMEGPVVFGMPTSEDQVMTKAKAKARYLLREMDFMRIKPYYDAYSQKTPDESQTTLDDEVPYLVQDLARVCMHRYGSEKEFRREQLRREMKRRRKSGRSSISDLPWDPALGKMPESVIREPVGQRAVHTAIATNSVVLMSKVVAFGYTGSASVLSEVIHSIADLGNQILLAVGISQSMREADALHPYGYATDRYVWSLISGVGISCKAYVSIRQHTSAYVSIRH